MSPEELLREARQKGISHLALTDINNTSGILDFFRLAQNYGIKPIAGIDFRNGADQKFIGIAKNHQGFYELNKFLSACSLSGVTIIPDKIPGFENAFVIFPFVSAFRTLSENEFTGIKISDLNRLQFSEWKNHPDKLVILHAVTFRNKTDFNTHRLLRAIDKNTLLSKLSVTEQAQPGEIMLAENELENKLSDHSFLIDNVKKISEQCSIDFQFGTNKNKKYFTGSADGDRIKLESLCEEGLHYRYKDPGKKRERIEKELNMIHEKDFASYFLINHEIVQYAKYKNFFYVGRGSGANSIVAYLLGITDVDPVELDLYFERFINPSRINPPDFDIDFSSDDRPEIIRHIFEIYGNDHTAQLATYNTFQANSVIRELGKVFGLPKAEIDALGDSASAAPSPSGRAGVGLDHITRLLYKYAQHIQDLPNHLSIHAGGILISELPIHYYTATTIPPKGFPLTQFSMLEAEDAGLYKFDILAQRGLGKIKDAIEIIQQNKNETIDIHDVQKFKEDKKVRQNLMSANLMGCFYVESPAMRMLLTKLEAKTYLDLVAASSIIRPGVASSGMMREYILRFKGKPPTYETPKPIYDILHDTFGVMVYQEDVIKVAYFFAGLTFGEADMLRRGMSGKYRARAEFQKVEKKFFDNCKEKGYDDKITKEVWRQIESFAGYAFSKGHSASYAVESYQCMFLKTYYPLEYMVAVINNGGGFYALEFYVHEARMCGGAIHAPDINRSESATVIYGSDIYLGYAHLQNLEKKVIEDILNERCRNGLFTSLADFMKRVSIAVEQLRILIRTGAFRFTGRTKKQLLWDIHTEVGAAKKTVAKKELFETEKKEYVLPELYHGKFDDAFDEMELLAFPLCNPFELIGRQRSEDGGQNLSANGVSSLTSVLRPPSSVLLAADLKNYKGKIVEITGYYVTSKHTQTKHKEHMMFGTFLDRDGYFFDTTHFPKIAAQFPFTGRGCYCIKGKVAEEFGFYSLDVVEMKRLDFISREEILQVQ
ncbi:MAG TPA: DNA polymerase III subunit alpha [Bacteroidia bacterium]|nr:DNA polymerase III subunit alpha [Bacteroidia bacterium]